MTSPSSVSFFVLLLTLLALLPSLSLSASPAFPSYSSYAGKPYTVSYDARSLRLNGEPVVFMSGSIHYPRSTPAMWPGLMKAAAADGLNMIQIYVFWNWHEPVEGQLDWSGRGNLTLFLDAIAAAGLFANLRIGPYVCAEWDYGGIPTWLAYKEGMRFRTTNQPWQDAVQKWMGTVINQTRAYFADRGGPIVLAQVENELHGAPQSYVDWSGDMANAFDVNVPWLMCNGQSANNTINTCNTNDCTNFLAEHGQSGRILKDQPAMWTENEGWFTSWGEETYPVMRTQEDRHPWELAWAVARWFARGGSHMNYYMWHGGNNYGSTGGNSLTMKYADGVNLHSDGLPNEPKKSHLMRLHQAIAAVSADLVAHPAQQFTGTPLPARNHSSDPWHNSTLTTAFIYGDTVFLENAGPAAEVQWAGAVYYINATSVQVRKGGILIYDTAHVAPATVTRVSQVTAKSSGWLAWKEPQYPSASSAAMPSFRYARPMEQLNVTRDLTDYCWYARNFSGAVDAGAALTLHAASANAFIAFVDGQQVGVCDDHSHPSTTTTVICTIHIATAIPAGEHSLSILSVSLGIENGMPSSQIPYVSHFKGLSSVAGLTLGSLNLTQGAWTLRPGLEGESRQLWTTAGRGNVSWSSITPALVGAQGVWYDGTVSLDAFPAGEQWALLLDLTNLNRGHCWVNGHDIGHYNLIEGGNSKYPTQWLYHVPQDWLVVGSNRLTILEELGGDPRSITLLTSTMQPTTRTQGRSRVQAE